MMYLRFKDTKVGVIRKIGQTSLLKRVDKKGVGVIHAGL